MRCCHVPIVEIQHFGQKSHELGHDLSHPIDLIDVDRIYWSVREVDEPRWIQA